MKLVHKWLKRLFLDHELWALRCATERSLLALLILGTLNFWWVLPSFVFSLVGILLFVNGFMAMTIVVGALGLLVILLTVLRGLEGGFMATGLMLGSGAKARWSLAELENSQFFMGSVDRTSPGANGR